MRKEIVALILEKNGKILVERRKKSKTTSPGSIITPAGHVNEGETKEEALKREMFEELGIKINNPELIHEADFDCEEKQKIYWYKCESYEGDIKSNEAQELLWIDRSEIDILSFQVSKDALNKFFANKNIKTPMS